MQFSTCARRAAATHDPIACLLVDVGGGRRPLYREPGASPWHRAPR